MNVWGRPGDLTIRPQRPVLQMGPDKAGADNHDMHAVSAHLCPKGSEKPVQGIHADGAHDVEYRFHPFGSKGINLCFLGRYT